MSAPYRLLAAAAVAAFAATGCSDRKKPQPSEDAGPRRRILKPPPSQVRALPPHNIYNQGMGPYKLGLGLNEVLELLPDGPRVELLGVDGLFDYRLMRSENGRLLVGVNSEGKVEFVAALDANVARTTEGGIGVGATRPELEQALGKPLERPLLLHDARILEFQRLPNTRFVIDGGRVHAVLVGGPILVADGAAAPPTCGKEPLGHADTVVREVARLPKGVIQPICAGAARGAMVVEGDQVVAVVEEGTRLRRYEAEPTPGLSLAAPLDCDGDGSQELVLLALSRSEAQVGVRVRVLRLEGTPARLAPLVDSELYGLSSSAAFAVGARLQDTDLLLELLPGSGAVKVTGLYLQRGTDGTVRNLVPLEEAVLSLPRNRASEKATVGDAGPEPGSDGASGGTSKAPGSRP